MAIGLGLSFAIVVTKRDKSSPDTALKIREQLLEEFPRFRFPLVESEKDIVCGLDAPLISVSCVTGQNLGIVKRLPLQYGT